MNKMENIRVKRHFTQALLSGQLALGGSSVRTLNTEHSIPTLRLPVRVLVLLVVAVLTGCGTGGTDGVVNMGSIAGSWLTPMVVPGTNTSLILAANGSRVTGTGSYSFEALRSGTLQVNGTATGVTFDLTLTYDYGPTADYKGQLTDSNHMSGTVHSAAWPDYTLDFVRQ